MCHALLRHSGDVRAGKLVDDALERRAGGMHVLKQVELDVRLLEVGSRPLAGFGDLKEFLKGDEGELGLLEVGGEDGGLQEPALGIAGELFQFAFDVREGVVVAGLFPEGVGAGVEGLRDDLCVSAGDDRGDGRGEETEDRLVPKHEDPEEPAHEDRHGDDLGVGAAHASGISERELRTAPERQHEIEGHQYPQPIGHGFAGRRPEFPDGPDEDGEHPAASHDEKFGVDHGTSSASLQRSTDRRTGEGGNCPGGLGRWKFSVSGLKGGA